MDQVWVYAIGETRDFEGIKATGFIVLPSQGGNESARELESDAFLALLAYYYFMATGVTPAADRPMMRC